MSVTTTQNVRHTKLVIPTVLSLQIAMTLSQIQIALTLPAPVTQDTKLVATWISVFYDK